MTFSLVGQVGWEQVKYTINEADIIGEACVLVFNPPTDVELKFQIGLTYQSVTGTAGIVLQLSPHLILLE